MTLFYRKKFDNLLNNISKSHLMNTMLKC